MTTFRIPRAAWPSIDRAINAATRKRNEGVPAQFIERATAFTVQRDAHSKRLVVSSVRFGLAEDRVRKPSSNEVLVAIK